MQLESLNLTSKCSTMSPGNPFILGSKGQRSRLHVTKTLPASAWVFALLWELVSSSYIRQKGILLSSQRLPHLSYMFFTSLAGAVAKYCNEHVCVCVCACLSVSISPEPHARSLSLHSGAFWVRKCTPPELGLCTLDFTCVACNKIYVERIILQLGQRHSFGRDLNTQVQKPKNSVLFIVTVWAARPISACSWTVGHTLQWHWMFRQGQMWNEIKTVILPVMTLSSATANVSVGSFLDDISDGLSRRWKYS